MNNDWHYIVLIFYCKDEELRQAPLHPARTKAPDVSSFSAICNPTCFNKYYEIYYSIGF